MAVLKMQRISICALKKDRKAILEKLQSLGVVEINHVIEEDEDFKKMKEQAARFKEEDLKTVLDLMIEAQNKMKYSSIMQLPLELVIIEMTGINR